MRSTTPNSVPSHTYRRFAVTIRTWLRNAMKELVTFAFDKNDRLIGVVDVPAGTLQDEELRIYIEALTKECDRFECALKGWDRE